MRASDIDRMAALGLVASVQPAHLLDDRAVTAAVWGEERAARSFPLRGLVDAGVRLALGSDAPVARLDPWLAMAAAVHRGEPGDAPWHPEHSLTAPEALAASTGGLGTVRPGQVADLALLDADPLARAHRTTSPVTSAGCRSPQRSWPAPSSTTPAELSARPGRGRRRRAGRRRSSGPVLGPAPGGAKNG